MRSAVSLGGHCSLTPPHWSWGRFWRSPSSARLRNGPRCRRPLRDAKRGRAAIDTRVRLCSDADDIIHRAGVPTMDKQVINADVPETGGPFNLCVRYGNLIFISGLPPFDAEFSGRLRDARARGLPLPP